MVDARRGKRFLALLAVLGVACAATPAPAREPATDGVRTIYLVRHGQHEDTGLGDPYLGSGLSALGAEQATMVAARLRSLEVDIDSLLVSPMTRAVETARPIAEALGLSPVTVPEIAECTPASWREDIMEGLGPGEADSCHAALEAAFDRFIRPTPETESRLVLVCHGNVIRYLVCRALGVDPLAWGGMMIRHASVTEIRIRPDGAVRLAGYADAGFQPPAKQSFSNISRK